MIDNRLQHVAICVDNFDRYLLFFQEVFAMKVSRVTESADGRQAWFDEGIQINEKKIITSTDSIVDHIAITVSNSDEIVSKAVALYGCTRALERENWIVLPNGLQIELL